MQVFINNFINKISLTALQYTLLIGLDLTLFMVAGRVERGGGEGGKGGKGGEGGEGGEGEEGDLFIF